MSKFSPSERHTLTCSPARPAGAYALSKNPQDASTLYIKRPFVYVLFAGCIVCDVVNVLLVLMFGYNASQEVAVTSMPKAGDAKSSKEQEEADAKAAKAEAGQNKGGGHGH